MAFSDDELAEMAEMEEREALADLAEAPKEPGPEIPPLIDPAAVGRLINAMEAQNVAAPMPPERPPLLAANLGLASTRELLEELEARGRLHGGHDGRQVETQARTWMISSSGRLAACFLDYRTVDLDAPAVVAAGRWQDRLVASEGGFYTSDRCTSACRDSAAHATPQAALKCTAREGQ